MLFILENNNETTKKESTSEKSGEREDSFEGVVFGCESRRRRERRAGVVFEDSGRG
jgi:hypothetical protein